MLPTAAAVLSVVLTASVFVVSRHLGHDLAPGSVSLGRLVVGSVLLGLLAATRPRVRIRRADWPPLVLCGLLWFGGYNLALNAAAGRLDAETSAMLVNLTPLLIVVLAGFLLHEGFPRRLLLGCVVSVMGVLTIGAAASSGQAELVGVVLCLLAAVLQAVAIVLQKSLIGRIPGPQLIWLACTIGAVSCLPFAPGLVADARQAPAGSWLWVLFLGVFPTAVAHLLWAHALARINAGRAGVLTYLGPPVAVVLAWFFLREVPGTAALVGGPLCLAGVVIATVRTRPGYRR